MDSCVCHSFAIRIIVEKFYQTKKGNSYKNISYQLHLSPWVFHSNKLHLIHSCCTWQWMCAFESKCMFTRDDNILIRECTLIQFSLRSSWIIIHDSWHWMSQKLKKVAKLSYVGTVISSFPENSQTSNWKKIKLSFAISMHFYKCWKI